jgi:hypothetical protein
MKAIHVIKKSNYLYGVIYFLLHYFFSYHLDPLESTKIRSNAPPPTAIHRGTPASHIGRNPQLYRITRPKDACTGLHRGPDVDNQAHVKNFAQTPRALGPFPAFPQ